MVPTAAKIANAPTATPSPSLSTNKRRANSRLTVRAQHRHVSSQILHLRRLNRRWKPAHWALRSRDRSV
jgi:hypothetical protein